MVIQDLTGGDVLGANPKFDIEKPISHIFFTFLFTGLHVAAYTTLIAALKDIIVSLSITSRNGKNIRLYDNIPLGDLVEMFVKGEGAAQLTTDVNGDVTGARVKIPVGVKGAIMVRNDENMVLKLEGLPASVDVKTAIYGHESRIRTANIVVVDQLSVPNGTKEKHFVANEVEKYAFPLTANLREVQLNYTNNVTCTYDVEQLKHIMLGANDSVVNLGNDVISGYSNLAVLEVQDVESIEVTLNSGEYIFYSVYSQQIAKTSKVLEQNLRLRNTVAPVKAAQRQLIEQSR